MSKEKLSSIKFDEQSKGFRTKLSTLFLLIIVIGYMFLYGYLAYVSASSWGIKLDLKDFEDKQPTNTSIGIDGGVVIDNSHWYSADITDISIKMSLYTDDDVKIKSKTITKDIIPRLTKQEIELDFDFTLADFDTFEDWDSLNQTDELKIKFEVKYTYAYIYNIDFEITMDTELD